MSRPHLLDALRDRVLLCDGGMGSRVQALTLDIELFTQVHYRQSIDPDTELSELFRDVFFFHWKEESQHAILDELEWVRHDAGITAVQRDVAVSDAGSFASAANRSASSE